MLGRQLGPRSQITQIYSVCEYEHFIFYCYLYHASLRLCTVYSLTDQPFGKLIGIAVKPSEFVRAELNKYICYSFSYNCLSELFAEITGFGCFYHIVSIYDFINVLMQI